MRAVIQKETGGPETLVVADIDKPVPSGDQVLVKVRAAGINPVDTFVRSGGYKLLGEPPFGVGWDIAGTVDAVGPDASGFSIGDDVFGMPYFPQEARAYAEYALAPAPELALKPSSLSFEEAGGLPLAGLTAWQALVTKAGLKAGQRVLIHAGAGGVGHLATQIAKAKGAYVVATASTGKLDFVKSTGADEVIDYTRTDFAGALRHIDIVLDTIGGDHLLKSLETLRPGGIAVCLKDLGATAPAAYASRGARLERIMVAPDAEGLAALAELADAGKLKVHVAKVFPLDQAGAAHDFLGGKPIGKVVLKI